MNAPLLIAKRREARLLVKRAVGLFVGAELCFMSNLRKLRDRRQPRGKAGKTAKLLIYMVLIRLATPAHQQGGRLYTQITFLGIMFLSAAPNRRIMLKIEIWV